MATITEALARALQYHQAGNLAQAERIYRQILQVNPADANALHLLGMLAHQVGQNQTALDLIRQAVALLPHVAQFHSNLAEVYRTLGRWDEAAGCYREALRLRPDLPEAHYNLGLALEGQGRPEEALASFQEALRLRPNVPDAHNNMGNVLIPLGRLAEAEASYREALRLRPDCAETLNNLAGVCRDQGRVDEAIACYRKAIAARPDLQSIRSNLLFTLHCSASYDPETAFAEHLRWGEQFHALLAPHRPLHPVLRDPGRRLRIGYVSGDFRHHVISYYSEAILGAHDRGQVEVFCYANVRHPDDRTQLLKALADHWRSLVGLSDALAADLILQDQIDVLVDLAGHTADNRLGVFAKKPAPIQVTHFGYPASTGLAAIDYRLTDAYCDPPGQTERLHVEKLIRLPKVQWCFVPLAKSSGLAIGPLPARRAGEVTFASFNNPAKVTEQMIGLWSQILKALPGSRMVMGIGAGYAGEDRIRAAFLRLGVGPEQVALVGRQPIDDYFQLYHGVDICLDTYPFTGCFTTADALWMGVPVVSLAGLTWPTRQGLAILSQVGLEDLVAHTPAAYVETAVRLARDLLRLHELRGQLRDRLNRSPLADVSRFTRHLEAAYRAMWDLFCRDE